MSIIKTLYYTIAIKETLLLYISSDWSRARKMCYNKPGSQQGLFLYLCLSKATAY